MKGIHGLTPPICNYFFFSSLFVLFPHIPIFPFVHFEHTHTHSHSQICTSRISLIIAVNSHISLVNQRHIHHYHLPPSHQMQKAFFPFPTLLVLSPFCHFKVEKLLSLKKSSYLCLATATILFQTPHKRVSILDSNVEI